MNNKYVYVVTESTSNSISNTDINVYNSIDSAHKDYKDRYDFYIRRYGYRHIYTRQITRNNQYEISSTIILDNGGKVTLKVVKTPVK